MKIRVALLAIAATGLSAASAPLKFSDALPGVWEVDGPDGPVRQCVAKVLDLAAFPHKGCTVKSLQEKGTTVRASISCAGGSFGQGSVSILTPRSVKVQAQGIADGAPYSVSANARRIGDCPGAAAAH